MRSILASPADTVAGYRRRARELGVTILEWAPVLRVRVAGDRARGVEAAGGTVEAPVVVLAAGAWAPGLCRDLGIELPARVKASVTAVVARPPAHAARTRS